MIRINYIQPYAVDKNIGREYNRMCAMIPDDEWICITDHDVMFLLPETKAQISEIVNDPKMNFDLLGCMTNRVGVTHHLPSGGFVDGSDMNVHIALSLVLKRKNSTKITPINGTIAGFLMLFHKKLWNYVKFEENTIHFDTLFSNAVRKHGGKLGIMQGVYVFHLYRWGQDNPRAKFDHLLNK